MSEVKGDQTCKVIFDNEEKECAQGTRFWELAQEYQKQYEDDIVLAVFNNKLRELKHKVETDGTLSFLTTADTKGRKAYRRSMIMLLEKAI